MKKIYLTILITLSVSTNLATAKTFSDISDANPLFNAIEYLSSKNIINGYNDGTFKPYNSINRAELLKLLMAGTATEIAEPKTHCFPDVPYTKWYSPYICTAKEAGIISGYQDGYFKPAQNINKVEALKIIGEIYNWDLSEKNSILFNDTPANQWYIPYLSYAKNHNLLPETGNTYKPETDMLRGNISEILYRYLSTLMENNQQPITTAPTPPLKTMANPDGEIIIILKWIDPESDFDAQLIEPNGEVIYFLHKISSTMKNYMETKDQTEIIHLHKLEEGSYHFSVVNFSKTKNFKETGVTVAVYDNKGLAEFYYAPSTTEETWEIFDLTDEGEIKPI